MTGNAKVQRRKVAKPPPEEMAKILRQYEQSAKTGEMPSRVDDKKEGTLRTTTRKSKPQPEPMEVV